MNLEIRGKSAQLAAKSIVVTAQYSFLLSGSIFLGITLLWLDGHSTALLQGFGDRNKGTSRQVLVSRAGSTGRCNTTWYKSFSLKGGVHEPFETMEAVFGPEGRDVESLEGWTVVK
jgi:hypothetical protein